MVRVLGFQVEAFWSSLLEALNQEKLNMVNGVTNWLVITRRGLKQSKAEEKKKSQGMEAKKCEALIDFRRTAALNPNGQSAYK